ncbi:MAG TPA: hypothetical protein PLD88_09070, partial [Candidatus Berkiella sp.]|nr:hypothetical protein [Candidatus Berkiella sp.]
MAIVERTGISISLCLASASLHETQLVEETIRSRYLEDASERIVYDSAPWMQSLKSDIKSNLLLPISQIEKKYPKMGALLEEINDDGELNGFLLGFSFNVEQKRDMTIMIGYILEWC